MIIHKVFFTGLKSVKLHTACAVIVTLLQLGTNGQSIGTQHWTGLKPVKLCLGAVHRALQ